MATYESVCKLTNKKEKIWFDMIPVQSLSDKSHGAIVGSMNDCSVHKRYGIGLCNECNIYKELPHN